jgi:hypothetical protein
LTLADESAYLRIHVDPSEPGGAARALAEAEPEPKAGPQQAALAGSVLARSLSRRLGSTALVSNLGRIQAPIGLTSVAFWPVAHGRSGVAVGAATVGNGTSLTLRARRASFGDAPAHRFLDLVVRRMSTASPG